MASLSELRVKLFADAADLASIERYCADQRIQGFTTNPTLMRKAGVVDYVGFSRRVLELVPELPVSFEVFSDEFPEMERQARLIAAWGHNVYVKIPITNVHGESSMHVVRTLADAGVAVNVTAIMTLDQVEAVRSALLPEVPAIVSIFAGRIADTGVDPMPIMREAHAMLAELPRAETLWASPRELLNLFQADACGTDIITATPEVLGKMASVGKDLAQFSLETVEMFHHDAAVAGYSL
ncbi:transaldolase [Bryocella elongata]|uniref:Transaldolase n=1 Tax=Bryocella elongata TaxID=863522 RepID=A0A1H5SPL1_9BACT|nr:transaldolase [Bryocella elongata]SEF52562.1 transaldolase [Bryocella elongata]